MTLDELYMRRCLELAENGEGYTAPNPMVGSVIVCKGEIAGEGWHKKYGEPHAEVNAIESVKDKSLFNDSTLYVNLEPCSHFGKTPPCADLIIRMGIPRVVVGMADPNPLVAGRGITKLREAGVDVTTAVLEEECRAFNAKFITFITRERPYITLKWAQTADGYIDNNREVSTPPTWMTGPVCKTLVCRMRAAHAAIMTGTNTVERDNPSLKAAGAGPDPLRVVIDRTLRLSPDGNVFDGSAPTLLITAEENIERARKMQPCIEVEGIDFSCGSIKNIIELLYKKGVQSLFVEGGAKIFQSLIEENLWDEANIFISPMMLSGLAGGTDIEPRGVKAPEIGGEEVAVNTIDQITLTKVHNK